MVDTQVQTEVLQILAELSLPTQYRALEYLRGLKSSLPPGSTGKELLKHAGRISTEDGLEMERIIEEECERINPDDWQISG